jgi:hypothetical protein
MAEAIIEMISVDGSLSNLIRAWSQKWCWTRFKTAGPFRDRRIFYT